MSLGLDKPRSGEAPPLTIARWVGLSLLLVGELVAFTLHFHTGAAARRGMVGPMPPGHASCAAVRPCGRWGRAAVRPRGPVGRTAMSGAVPGRGRPWWAFLIGHTAAPHSVPLALGRRSRGRPGAVEPVPLRVGRRLVRRGRRRPCPLEPGVPALRRLARLLRRLWKPIALGSICGPLCLHHQSRGEPSLAPVRPGDPRRRPLAAGMPVPWTRGLEPGRIRDRHGIV